MKRLTTTALALLCGLSLAACAKSSHVSTQSAGAASSATASAGGTVLVKAGTIFYGRLQRELSSKTSTDGQTFQLDETDTLLHRNAALHGAVIDGHLEGVAAAGLGKKPAMTIVFDDIKMPDGATAPIDVQLLSLGAFDAKSHKLRTLGMMVGGAIAGHEAAKVAGKHHGGVIGAVGGYVLSQELKTDIDVKPGTTLKLKFLRDAIEQTSATPSASATGS